MTFWDRLLGPDTISEDIRPKTASPSFFCPTCVVSSEVFRCPKCNMTCEFRVSVWDLLIDGVVPKPVLDAPAVKQAWKRVKLLTTSWIKGQASLTIYKLLRDGNLPENAKFTRADLRKELEHRGYLKFLDGRSMASLRSHIAQRQHGKAKSKDR